MACWLSVDLLPSSFTDQDLCRLLAISSGVCRSHIVTNSEGRSLGFALIAMATTAEAERVIQTLDGAEIGGQPIRISRLGTCPED